MALAEAGQVAEAVVVALGSDNEGLRAVERITRPKYYYNQVNIVCPFHFFFISLCDYRYIGVLNSFLSA